MKAPRRLMDESELFARIVAEDARHEPPSAALEELLRDLPPSRSSIAGEPSRFGGRTAKWLAGLGLAVLVAVPLVQSLRASSPVPVAPTATTASPRSPEAASPESASPEPRGPSTLAIAVGDLPDVAPGGSESRGQARLSKPASSAPKPSVRREIELIAAARQALSNHAPDLCLASLDRYDGEFPGGQFTMESNVMRIEATAAKGDRERTRELARTFLSKHPSSAYDTRVRSLLSSAEAR